MAVQPIYWFFLIQVLQISRVYAKVPAIIVFGDSSVDAGNNNQLSTILKSDFPPYGRDFYNGKPTGRFSNGKIAPDFVSAAFGIKPLIPAFLDPLYNIKDFATGVCFASAGTGYDNATSDVLRVMPLWKELDYFKQYQQDLSIYLGDREAEKVLGEALYITSVGTNDFLENYYVFSKRSKEYSTEEYQNFLASIARNFITELYLLGARKISIGGLPPMGCLPLERAKNILFGSDCVEAYNDVAKSFNYKLQELVDKLNQQLVGIQLVFSNPYYILSAITQNPQSFGFDTATTACCGTGLFEMGYMCAKINPFTCSDANKYVFWDAFHPTERTHGIVADHLFKTSLAQFV